MHKLKDGLYKHGDYHISQGSYIGTTDDRIEGWYVDPVNADTLDRRGPGFDTLAEAVQSINVYLQAVGPWAMRSG
jgi:hypothetical protein